jgi:hypothetical protein
LTQPARNIDRRNATEKVRVDYAHVGLLDTADLSLWIARKRFGVIPLRVSHAQLLTGGSSTTSVAEKDRFLCYWYHTPNTGEGLVHGYPIEWHEAHLMIRMDPNWDYKTQTLLPSTDERRIEKNIDRQYEWARRIFQTYVTLKPNFPLSWHFMGPRPSDSMFYVERHEP